jgi:hypothetical protein
VHDRAAGTGYVVGEGAVRNGQCAGLILDAPPDVATPFWSVRLKHWDLIIHKAGAENIGTYDAAATPEVDAAADNGLSVALNGYNLPTGPLVQKMKSRGMVYIEYAQWLQQMYDDCRAWFVAHPKTPCTISADLEAAVKAHLAQVHNDPNVVGFWVLDDYPGGDITPTLQAIHELIAQDNASRAFPRPTICGFGGSMDLKTSSSQASFSPNHASFDQALTNFSPAACDMVALYPYGFSAWNDQRAIDWSMTNLLPYMKRALKAKGWNHARQPLIGMPQTFGVVPWTPWTYIAPTAASVHTQTAAYCAGGASTVVAYAWHDFYISDTYPNSPELYNDPGMLSGYAAGIRQCQADWRDTLSSERSSSNWGEGGTG